MNRKCRRLWTIFKRLVTKKKSLICKLYKTNKVQIDDVTWSHMTWYHMHAGKHQSSLYLHISYTRILFKHNFCDIFV